MRAASGPGGVGREEYRELRVARDATRYPL